MKLYEFFGKDVNPTKQLEKKRKEENIGDDLFWYIIDHDRLHKDHFYSAAKKLKKSHQNNKTNKEELVKEFMPMVKKGCMEYYHHKKLKGHAEKLFTKELKQDLCEKLFDHYFEDIINDNYQIG